MILRISQDPLRLILPLLEGVKESSKDVYLIPQQFLYDAHPDKVKSGFRKWFFDEKSNPGRFRKLIQFIASYTKRSTVKFGEPINLNDYLKDKTNLLNQAKLLSESLLNQLEIERKSVVGSDLVSKDQIKKEIFADENFQKKLLELSDNSPKKFNRYKKQGEKIFYEIASDINYNYITAYDRIFRWVSKNIYEGIDIDTISIQKLKKVAGNNPVVLVPCHRSHIDYILLSYVLYNFNLTLPHICAGNNLSFWPLGRFLRKGGGFFIRRSFKGDDLYKLILSNYISKMIHHGYFLEFFIEGSRSRTGKMLKPKMGILSMIIQSYLEGNIKDIYFVPVSVNYERTLEEKSYQNEMKGGDKKKESISSLLKLPQFFNRRYGQVFVRMADPISLKSYLSTRNITKGSKSNKVKSAISEYAYELTYQINKVSTVTMTSIISMALASFKDNIVVYHEMVQRIDHLVGYLKYKKVHLTKELENKNEKIYREVLEQFKNDKVISFYEDFDQGFYKISRESRSFLDQQKNGSLHFFVLLSMVSKIFTTNQKLSFKEIEKHLESIKTILRHDFTFSSQDKSKLQLEKSLKFLLEENLILKSDDQYMIQNQARLDFYASLIDHFIESAYLSLNYIENFSFEKTNIKKLSQAISDQGQNLYLKKELKYYESLSHITIGNMIKAFVDIGLVKVDEEGAYSREFDADSIKKWKSTLKNLLNSSNNQFLMPEKINLSQKQEVAKEFH